MRQRGTIEDTKGKLNERVVLFVTAMASFLTPFMASAVNVAIPTIGGEFGADAVALSWIATAFLLTGAIFVVPWGRLADIYGRKRIFLYGVIGFAVTSLLCGFSPSVEALIVIRGIQGITTAMMFSTAVAIVSSVYPPQRRGRAIGMTVTGVYIGLALGPFVGGIMTHYLGWRSIFFLAALLGSITAWFVVTRIRMEWAEARGQRLDIVGAVIFGLALLAVMYGFSTLPSITGLVLLVAGVVLIVIFVLWESRVPNPLLDISLFRHNIVFALSNLSALINYAATFALTFMLSLYLQYIQGMDPQSAGIVLLVQPLIMALLSSYFGHLSDRVEPRILASTGMGLTTVGLAMLTFLDMNTSLAYILIVLALCGLGFALFSSPNQNAIMGCVDRSCYGVASATTSEMRMVGQMLSMGIASLVLAVYVGDVQITPQYYPAFLEGFRFAFIIFAAMCLVGVFASLARGRLHSQAKR